MTDKELYDAVTNTRQEIATAPYSTALENLTSVKFTSTADKYIKMSIWLHTKVLITLPI